MTDVEISDLYDLIKSKHARHLASLGVKLPSLKRGGSYTKDALVLVYLAQGYPNTTVVSKDELTQFIRCFYPEVNDVQQARHLGNVKGWYILSGTRMDNASIQLNWGEYKLISLEECYPGFNSLRRADLAGEEFFEELKRQYGYRCATCGSKEGELNYRYPNTFTKLEKGHMNPMKPLEPGNIIPQCEKCNKADKNYWVYDEKGRVIGIANEKVVDNCSEDLKTKIYLRLKEKLMM